MDPSGSRCVFGGPESGKCHSVRICSVCAPEDYAWKDWFYCPCVQTFYTEYCVQPAEPPRYVVEMDVHYGGPRWDAGASGRREREWDSQGAWLAGLRQRLGFRG